MSNCSQIIHDKFTSPSDAIDQMISITTSNYSEIEQTHLSRKSVSRKSRKHRKSFRR
jgi:hypothetical protein